MSKSRRKKLPSWATWKERASYLISGVAIGTAFGAGAVSFEGDLPFPSLSNISSRLPVEIPEGVPVSGPLVLKRKGYTVCYDGARKQPLWVHERLTPDRLKEGATRSDQFKEDRELPKHLRSLLGDYKRSGYDRGHLAAAGNHKASRSEMEETFLLSNMSPQVGKGFNRAKWKELEERVRGVVKQSLYVDVISGPLYLPEAGEVRYPVIGKSDVAVPTHFFKVALAADSKGNKKREAWVLPNREIPAREKLSSYEVSTERVEQLAGILIK